MMAGRLHRNDFFQTLCVLVIGIILSDKSRTTAQNMIRATDWPVDTNVIYGDSVTFLVTVIEPSSESQILKWFIEWDVDIETIRLVPSAAAIISDTERSEFAGRGKYSTGYSARYEGAYRIHTCTLTINNMNIKDNGYFGLTHQINPGDRHRTLLKNKIRLTVVPVPTTDPECTLNIHYRPNKNTDILTCLSTGDPPAVLTWHEGNQQIGGERSRNSTIEIASDPNLQRTFVCRAVPNGFPEYAKTCTITLNPPSTTPSDSDTTQGATTTTAATTATSTATTFMTTDNSTSSQDTTQEVVPTDNTALIVGLFLGLLILLLLILLPLLFLLYRRRKQHSDQENPVPAPQPMSELPTMDLPQHTVVDNPYGALTIGAAGPSVEQTDTDSDSDLEKPWKKNPEMLNEGYEDDEFDEEDNISGGVGSGTESYSDYFKQYTEES